MGHHHHHHHHHHPHGDSPYEDPFLRCFCCPCFLVSSILQGFGRCLSAACYPLFRCFGYDDWGRPHRHYY
ncbi:hypothetical protein COLO4_08296 [Corchorus olitorius]|uniref:Uncharacterized protein n=1 Tax=Corchorus olitorius TaxID=93759 RepID=A0A1R3KGD7_9ROSI|nr:hypothetical protein COLO4_08296 [Corchorus olitorius]